jgi:hypothetical protein
MGFWEKYFEPSYFFVAFFIGMFLVYISVPTPEVIIRYPTPHNSGKMTYKDTADMCYVYDAKEVECSKDAIDTPLQHMSNVKKNSENIFSKIIPGL